MYIKIMNKIKRQKSNLERASDKIRVTILNIRKSS